MMDQLKLDLLSKTSDLIDRPLIKKLQNLQIIFHFFFLFYDFYKNKFEKHIF